MSNDKKLVVVSSWFNLNHDGVLEQTKLAALLPIEAYVGHITTPSTVGSFVKIDIESITLMRDIVAKEEAEDIFEIKM